MTKLHYNYRWSVVSRVRRHNSDHRYPESSKEPENCCYPPTCCNKVTPSASPQNKLWTPNINPTAPGHVGYCDQCELDNSFRRIARGCCMTFMYSMHRSHVHFLEAELVATRIQSRGQSVETDDRKTSGVIDDALTSSVGPGMRRSICDRRPDSTAHQLDLPDTNFECTPGFPAQLAFLSGVACRYH